MVRQSALRKLMTLMLGPSKAPSQYVSITSLGPLFYNKLWHLILSQAWAPYSITSLGPLFCHKLRAPYNDHDHPNPFVRDDGCMRSWPPCTPEMTMAIPQFLKMLWSRGGNGHHTPTVTMNIPQPFPRDCGMGRPWPPPIPPLLT